MDHGLAATIPHVIGAGIIIGIVFLSLAIALKPNLQVEDIKWLQYIRSFGMAGALLLLITGVYLAVEHWEHVGKNPLFWAKMTLFVVDGIIAERVIAVKMKRILAGTAIDTSIQKDLSLWSWVSALVVFLIVTIALFLGHN